MDLHLLGDPDRPPRTDPSAVAAVVLTGGSGVRLGGVEKHGIEVGGRTLLEHALEVVADADEVVVVGPEVPTSRPVTFVREDPPGGGPAAGLLAALGVLRAHPRGLPATVVALAVDMPLVTRSTVGRLLSRLRGGRAGAPGSGEAGAGAAEGPEGPEGVVLVDGEGRRQFLCAAYDSARLLAAHPADRSTYGLAMRRLLFGLRLVELPAEGAEAHDIDTWADLRDLDAVREQHRRGTESPEGPGGGLPDPPGAE